jgi:hypothetical protein
MIVACKHPFDWRGDHAGGPCAILACPETATTQVTWAPTDRLHEHSVWYCWKDAQAALDRAGRGSRGAQITAQRGGEAASPST